MPRKPSPEKFLRTMMFAAEMPAGVDAERLTARQRQALRRAWAAKAGATVLSASEVQVVLSR